MGPRIDNDGDFDDESERVSESDAGCREVREGVLHRSMSDEWRRRKKSKRKISMDRIESIRRTCS